MALQSWAKKRTFLKHRKFSASCQATVLPAEANLLIRPGLNRFNTKAEVWHNALNLVRCTQFRPYLIPVKIYNATISHTFDFDLLRRSDHCRIHYAKVCKETGEEVPKEIVRGYQYRKGDYVIVEEEDFSGLMSTKPNHRNCFFR